MREIIYRNLVNPGSKKRDVSLEEIVERNGMVSSTKKRSMYFIRGSRRIRSEKELHEWMNKRRKSSVLNKKFFHIFRKFSTKTKEDKLVCKMRGSFYIMSGQSVYDIVFVHAIKIKFAKSERGKCI